MTARDGLAQRKTRHGAAGSSEGKSVMLDLSNHIAPDAVGQQRTVSKTAADWFHYTVIRSRREVFSEVVEVTPEIAHLFLGGNEANRSVTQSHVNKLAADMTEGRWDLNGESIKIARDGRLADGQHRLYAVVQSNTPIRTVVTFGVDYDSRITTDQGKAKAVGDYLAMSHGTKNAHNAAAVSRFLLMHRLGVKSGGGNSPVTKTRIYAEYEAHKTDIDSAVTFMANRQTARVLGGVSTIAAVLVLLRRKHPSADDFIEKFIKGTELTDNDPILVARDRLIRTPNMRLGDKITLLTKAFDAWLEGRGVTKFIVKARKVKK